MKEIELSKTGKNKGKYKALVDNDVFEEVNKYSWSYHQGYAYNGKMRIQLQRYIWELKYGKIPEGMLVDHIDRNPLNNQISNLRLATYTENNRNISKTKRNTSGYIGVCKAVNKNECQDGTIHIHKYWQCSWQDNFGRGRSKNFPYDNVGKVRAARYFDLMAVQIKRNYTGELNFQSLEEYQRELKKAILEDIKSN